MQHAGGHDAVDWLLRNRVTGRRTVRQVPNVRLVVALGTLALRLVLSRAGTPDVVLAVVGHATLAWWAVDEVVQGVNPFRRLLGLGVLVGQVISWLA